MCKGTLPATQACSRCSGTCQQALAQSVTTCCLVTALHHEHHVVCCRAQAHEQGAPFQAALQQQRQVVAAWQTQAVQQVQWRARQMGHAVRWHSRRVQHAAFSSWHCMCVISRDQAQRAQALRRKHLLSRAIEVGSVLAGVLVIL